MKIFIGEKWIKHDFNEFILLNLLFTNVIFFLYFYKFILKFISLKGARNGTLPTINKNRILLFV